MSDHEPSDEDVELFNKLHDELRAVIQPYRNWDQGEITERPIIILTALAAQAAPIIATSTDSQGAMDLFADTLKKMTVEYVASGGGSHSKH